MAYSKYETYKDSGIPWLGEIPVHWEVRKLKNDSTIKNGATPSTSNQKYWDGDIIWITPAEINNIKFIDKSKRKITEEGYLSCGTSLVPINTIVLTTRAPIGKLVIANKELCTNQGCKSIIPLNFHTIFQYYQLLIRTKELNALGTGTTFMELGNSELKNLKYIAPPLQEQTAIASFLDYKTEKINRFIKKKKQLIKLLKEQKAAIINQAVTKGLDSNVPMKDSGKEWLGEIPEHWEVKPLKYFVTANDEALPNNTDKEYELNYIDIGNVNSNGNIDEIVKYKFKDAPSRARRIVKIGDVIISTVRTYLKAIAIIDNDMDVIVSTGFAVLRPRDNIASKFLNYAVRANYFIEDICSNSFGVSYPAINTSELVTLKLSVPRSKSEQHQIVHFIETETQKLDKTISTIEKEITLVEEYKTALIAEAVTGKIDVGDFIIPKEEIPLAMVAEEATSYNKSE